MNVSTKIAVIIVASKGNTSFHNLLYSVVDTLKMGIEKRPFNVMSRTIN